MNDNSNFCSKLENLKGSVTYKCLEQSNGRFTVTVAVDDDLHFGYGFSLETAKNQAAASALLNLNTDKKIGENRNAFYLLKEKRRGLIFQSIRKNKGLFDVSVQVDFVKYFGRGETQSKANNVCATKVLAAFESGDHERSTQTLYKNAFKKLSEMYGNLLYRTLSTDDTDGEDKCEVHVNIDGIDYFGEGESISEAKNDAAWAVLKSVWSGDHKKQLNEIDEYWYDDDDYSSSVSSEYNSCDCCCHSCGCC
ncbi:uncharacterized protein LOC119080240 [Bradysia coprophila]|uniref:uncharacterized protein LOC119080240 n=1 Tax=Bradysia coprophila TaxID=38358 RepID=UPI00187D8D75|nr:uncharacterized protein LOC119080240 [Bradysia coprophila]